MLKHFDEIRKHIKDFDNKRESTIAISRNVIRISKQIIYSIHRDDLKTAESLIKEIKNELAKLDKKHYDTNIDCVAFQEYVEALTYYEFVKTGKIPSFKDLKVDVEHYLLGLCDLTGELVRKAVNDIIRKKYGNALKIKELVEEIYGEFLKLDLRNNELRVKSDSIKYNLKKLEDIVYDLKIKGLL